MDPIYVPVRATGPTTKQNSVRNACNIVRVGVSYVKGRGIVASATPGESKDGYTSLLIMQGEYITLAPATRLNRKQVEVWEETAQNHVDLRQDIIWGLVEKVCQANGLAPVAPE